MNSNFGKSLLLLQINDPFFPMGAFAHSYGLETYVQKGIVNNAQTALEYIRSNIMNSLLFNDFLAVKLAFESTNIEMLMELDEIYFASKAPKEIRLAGEKLASRFMKNISSLKLELKDIYKEYCLLVAKGNCHGQFPLLYGTFCAASEIDRQSSVTAFAYSQVSGIVNNCVKLIPLSQTDGQMILNKSFEIIKEALSELQELGIDDLGLSAPGFELRSMQHEVLYSRLYMS